MNATPPPPVVIQQKKGMGCFGIGCIVVVIVVLLVGGLVAGLGYLAYSKVSGFTSATPIATRTFDGGDELFRTASQKVAAFQQAEQLGRPASLELNADEINTLIARNPGFAEMQAHAFVAMSGDSMQVDLSVSTNVIPLGLIKDRFINGSANLSPTFNPDSRTLSLTLHKLKLGNQDVPNEQLATIQQSIDNSLNTKMQSSPDAKNFLDRARKIEVRDGKLEIETK